MGSLKIQPNYLTKNRCYQQNNKRTPIGIQIHTIGCAQGTAQAVADYWNQSSVQACVTYICDADECGKVLKLLDEDVATWADAGYGNRNLITIEVCESDFMRYISGASYEVTNNERFVSDVLRGYDTAVLLCADICSRYGWDPTEKLSSGLYLISSHDEGRVAGLSSAHVDPTHLWPRIGLSMDTFRSAVSAVMKNDLGIAFTEVDKRYYRVRKTWKDASSQLGAYESLDNAKAACPYLYSVFDQDGKKVYSNKKKPVSGTQASAFLKLTETEAAEKMLELVKEADTSGIFPSVTTAQMILESGYGKTALAQSSNNCFGMKTSLSGNTWDSVWDGKSSVTTSTWESVDGKPVTIDAEFRKYPDVETSIRDHSAYLLGAMNGDRKRYEGLLYALTAQEAIKIIWNGGYATDPDYITKVMSIINRFGLDRYDPVLEEPEGQMVYRVQIGSYKYKYNAKRKVALAAEKTKYPIAIVREDDGQFVVICGSFKKRENAIKRASTLKKKGIDAIVKGVVL